MTLCRNVRDVEKLILDLDAFLGPALSINMKIDPQIFESFPVGMCEIKILFWFGFRLDIEKT